MKSAYPARIEKDESDMFFVQFLDINEAVTEGETLGEALFNAREVLTLTIESRIEEGMEIPFPSQQVADTIYFISPSSKGLENSIIHQY